MRDGDVTTDATVPPRAGARGVFLVKADCVLAGLDVAFEAFRQLEPGGPASTAHKQRRRRAAARARRLPKSSGPPRALLVGERTALNFLQRLSGIATRARRFVDAAGGRITVLDTRKTTPTLRALEKYAVRAGGATNHRVGLFDAILIKDNHIRLAGGVEAAVERARELSARGCRSRSRRRASTQVDEALAAGADTILVDNLSLDEIREAVAPRPRPREDRDLRRRHARAHAGARRDRRRLRVGRRADAFGAGRRHQL